MPPATPGPSILRQSLSLSRLPREFFTCRQCLQRPQPARTARQWIGTSHFRGTSKYTSGLLAAFRVQSSKPVVPRSFFTTAATPAAGEAVSKSRFPEISSKGTAYWLLASAASVFGIVVFGGLTRLTESGYGNPEAPTPGDMFNR